MARDEPLPEGALDEAHFRAVHFHLFQNLHEWACETRTVRLSKGEAIFATLGILMINSLRSLGALPRTTV